MSMSKILSSLPLMRQVYMFNPPESRILTGHINSGKISNIGDLYFHVKELFHVSAT
jgi:hypothetical protein